MPKTGRPRPHWPLPPIQVIKVAIAIPPNSSSVCVRCEGKREREGEGGDQRRQFFTAGVVVMPTLVERAAYFSLFLSLALPIRGMKAHPSEIYWPRVK